MSTLQNSPDGTHAPANLMSMSRRTLLAQGLVAAAGVAVAGVSDPMRRALAGAPKAPRVAFDLDAVSDYVQLRPGAQTGVWRYAFRQTAGAAGTVMPGPSYLGPTINVPLGTSVRCKMSNGLAAKHIIHWHGLEVPAEADGHPADAVDPGRSFIYDFPVPSRAGTYWYHPHTDMLTGVQAYMGLAGLFIVTDPKERELGLPAGDRDLPLVLQDRKFDANNQLIFADPGNTVGMLGDTILTNGTVNASFNVANVSHRLRVLNGSNARIYKLAWSDGSPITVIGSDGGLLPAPVTRPYLMVAPGERYELYVDWRSKQVGQSVTLQSLAFQAVIPGQTTLVNGAAFSVCQFNIVRAEVDTSVLPSSLRPMTLYRLQDARNATTPRTVTLGYVTNIPNCAPCWAINGSIYSMNSVRPQDVVPAGQLEVIEITNPILGPAMPHPMHWHGAHFQILSRERLTTPTSTYNTVNQGFCDAGWKDTVLIYPGERIRILMKWTKHTGVYLYHCHNLEHEDHGMMLNYRVV